MFKVLSFDQVAMPSPMGFSPLELRQILELNARLVTAGWINFYAIDHSSEEYTEYKGFNIIDDVIARSIHFGRNKSPDAPPYFVTINNWPHFSGDCFTEALKSVNSKFFPESMPIAGQKPGFLRVVCE